MRSRINANQGAFMCKSIPEKPIGNMPVTYAKWDKKLYEDGDMSTYTRVINSSAGTLPRFAYGRSNDGLLCFYVELTPADELEFHKTYNAWLKSQTNQTAHTYLSDPPGHPPPACGTSNDAPPC
jgi:hypothetical protein